MKRTIWWYAGWRDAKAGKAFAAPRGRCDWYEQYQRGYNAFFDESRVGRA